MSISSTRFSDMSKFYPKIDISEVYVDGIDTFVIQAPFWAATAACGGFVTISPICTGTAAMIDVEILKNGFRIGEWDVQPRLGSMARHGKALYPSRQTIQVLLILASHEGRFVSRSQLVEQVWDDPAVGNVTLNRCMHELNTLFDDASYVRIVPARGYRVGQAVRAQTAGRAEESSNAYLYISLGILAMAVAMVGMVTVLY